MGSVPQEETMSDFPTALTNAVDGTTEILAKHINNLEAKVGVDGSGVATSLDYKVNNGVVNSDKVDNKHYSEIASEIDSDIAAHAALVTPHPSATSIGGKTLPSGTIVGTTDSQVLTNKEATAPKLTAQAMISEEGANEGEINYANNDNRKAVGGRALEVIVKSPDDANYYREILSNRQDCIKYDEIIAYP